VIKAPLAAAYNNRFSAWPSFVWIFTEQIPTDRWKLLRARFASFVKVNHIPARFVYGLGNLGCGSLGSLSLEMCSSGTK